MCPIFELHVSSHGTAFDKLASKEVVGLVSCILAGGEMRTVFSNRPSLNFASLSAFWVGFFFFANYGKKRKLSRNEGLLAGNE